MPVSKATADKIQKLENDHKEQFVNLVMSNHTFIKLLPKIHGKPKTSKEYQSLMALGHVIAKNAGKWYARQQQYELRAGVPKADKNIMKYFLVPKDEHKLIAEAKQYISPASTFTMGAGNSVSFFDMMNKYIATK